MLFAVGIATADSFSSLIKTIEVLAQILTSRILYLLRQVFYTFLHSTCRLVIICCLVFPVAKEAASLGDMIKRTSEQIAVAAFLHIQLLINTPATCSVWIDTLILICALPTHKGFILQRVYTLNTPPVQFIRTKGRTKPRITQHSQHTYLAHLSTPIDFSKTSMLSALSCPRFFNCSFLNIHTLLKNLHTLVNEFIPAFRQSVNHCPTQRIGAGI